MNRSYRIKPQAKHWELYSQTPCEVSPLVPSRRRERKAWIFLISILITLIVPLVPSRHHYGHFPTTLDEYTHMLVGSAAIAVLVAVLLWEEWLLKPARNHKLGYHLMGRFVVQGKQQLFGSSWLELPPDDTHRVGVPDELFATIEKGDTVEVAFSASKEFISLRKISSPGASA